MAFAPNMTSGKDSVVLVTFPPGISEIGRFPLNITGISVFGVMNRKRNYDQTLRVLPARLWDWIYRELVFCNLKKTKYSTSHQELEIVTWKDQSRTKKNESGPKWFWKPTVYLKKTELAIKNKTKYASDVRNLKL